MQKETRDVAIKRPHQRRRWTWWLIPRPFSLVSTAFYLCVFIPFLVLFATGQQYQGEWWRVLLMTAAIALFFAIDRLEYWRYGEETPLWIALVLFVMRILLYEAVAWLDSFNFSPILAVFMPVLGFWYFGSAVAYGLGFLACVDYALHHVVNTPDWLTNPYQIHANYLFVRDQEKKNNLCYIAGSDS